MWRCWAGQRRKGVAARRGQGRAHSLLLLLLLLLLPPLHPLHPQPRQLTLALGK